jgi:hypothetical protein
MREMRNAHILVGNPEGKHHLGDHGLGFDLFELFLRGIKID